MIATTSILRYITLVFFFLAFETVTAQQDSIQKLDTNKRFIQFYELRGNNVIETGVGTSVINGDFQDPLFEIYFKGGYKRYLSPHIAIGVTYHKFNLAYEDVFNFGYMSFDLNLEYLVLPHRRFSPYIFAGGGYNAANYFESTTTKLQAGLGIEYIVTEGLGFTLFSDYNYTFDDTLDGLEAGASDDTYFRMGFGINFYFGNGRRKNRYAGEDSEINNNLIYPVKKK